MARFLAFLVCFTLTATNNLGYKLESSLNNRIVGGSRAPFGGFPYQASVWWNNDFAGGAVIISKLWVLTSAQNVVGKNASDIIVIVGTNNLFEGGEKLKANSVEIHSEYNSHTFQNDIGLVQLKYEIEFSDTIGKIELADSDVPVGKTAFVVGWGTRKASSGTYAKHLQYLEVSVISSSECKQDLAPKVIQKHNICTFPWERKGICLGDDGGALVYKKKLAAIASWSVSCAVGKPDVFVSVHYFYDWIQNIINRKPVVKTELP